MEWFTVKELQAVAAVSPVLWECRETKEQLRARFNGESSPDQHLEDEIFPQLTGDPLNFDYAITANMCGDCGDEPYVWDGHLHYFLFPNGFLVEEIYDPDQAFEDEGFTTRVYQTRLTRQAMLDNQATALPTEKPDVDRMALLMDDE